MSMWAEDFDLPTDKRRLYAISALDDIDISEELVRDVVLQRGWLADTPDNCDCVSPSARLDKWLRARDRDLQNELKQLCKRLREKWSAA